MLYAPYSNVGQLNLDRAEGYINIPDSSVVFTRVDDEKGDVNEGQKIVFDLQDAA